MPKAYSDKLSAEDQINCEEALHSIIFDNLGDGLGEDASEERIADIAKRCTAEVLRRFRPDLFER